MTAQRAFLGELRDIGFLWKEGLMVVHVALPVGEFDAFTRGVGTPGHSAALLGCPGPLAYPEGDDDALAFGALELLIAALQAGKVRRSQTFHDRLDALVSAAMADPPGGAPCDVPQPGSAVHGL